MGIATKSTKSHGKVQPTPKAMKAATPPPPAPANETTILPDGTIERRQHGQLVKRTPPAKAAATPAAPKASPAEALAAPIGPTPGELFYVAKLGTDDIWPFAPVSVKPGAAVVVRHFTGYDVLAEHRRSAAYADKLYHDLLKSSFTSIDGVTLTLVDEEA